MVYLKKRLASEILDVEDRFLRALLDSRECFSPAFQEIDFFVKYLKLTFRYIETTELSRPFILKNGNEEKEKQLYFLISFFIIIKCHLEGDKYSRTMFKDVFEALSKQGFLSLDKDTREDLDKQSSSFLDEDTREDLDKQSSSFLDEDTSEDEGVVFFERCEIIFLKKVGYRINIEELNETGMEYELNETVMEYLNPIKEAALLKNIENLKRTKAALLIQCHYLRSR